MRPFTDEEFDQMIAEMTSDTHPSFDMLCSIADRTVRPFIRSWCARDHALAGRGLEEDMMQDIFCRLIKTSAAGFFFREGRTTVNRDPDGFKNWMLKVAENIKRDTANAYRRGDHRERYFEEGEAEQLPEDETEKEMLAMHRERLTEAFQIVLDADVRVYKVLTWLAQSLFIICYDITKIQSNDVIVERFSDRSLFEMRDIVLSCADRVEWIRITPAQSRRIDLALHAHVDGKLVGELKYRDFFMKKGGKATISDWVNRMNRMIESLVKK